MFDDLTYMVSIEARKYKALQEELNKLRQRVVELENIRAPEPQPEEKPWLPYEGELCEFSQNGKDWFIAQFEIIDLQGRYRTKGFGGYPLCRPIRDPNIIQLRERKAGDIPAETKGKRGYFKMDNSDDLLIVDFDYIAWARVTHYAVVEDVV